VSWEGRKKCPTGGIGAARAKVGMHTGAMTTEEFTVRFGQECDLTWGRSARLCWELRLEFPARGGGGARFSRLDEHGLGLAIRRKAKAGGAVDFSATQRPGRPPEIHGCGAVARYRCVGSRRFCQVLVQAEGKISGPFGPRRVRARLSVALLAAVVLPSRRRRTRLPRRSLLVAGTAGHDAN